MRCCTSTVSKWTTRRSAPQYQYRKALLYLLKECPPLGGRSKLIHGRLKWLPPSTPNVTGAAEELQSLAIFENEGLDERVSAKRDSNSRSITKYIAIKESQKPQDPPPPEHKGHFSFSFVNNPGYMWACAQLSGEYCHKEGITVGSRLIVCGLSTGEYCLKKDERGYDVRRWKVYPSEHPAAESAPDIYVAFPPSVTWELGLGKHLKTFHVMEYEPHPSLGSIFKGPIRYSPTCKFSRRSQ